MLSEKIKQLASLSNEAAVPMAIMFGEVQSPSPLQILVDNRFQIEGDMIILPKDITISNGDKAILLRNAGGQQFLVVGRL